MADVTPHDAELQRLYQQAGMRADGAHPDEATWERLATAELDDDARAALFDHVVTCARCAVIWRGMQELRKQAEDEGLIARADYAPTTWSRSRILPFAIAATLLVAVGGGLLINRQPVNAPDTLRSSGQLPAVEGLMTAADANGVTTFVWTPLSQANRYRIEVYSDDGRPVWSNEVDGSLVQWPAGVPRTGGTYRWRVDALNGGSVVARSRVATMEVPR